MSIDQQQVDQTLKDAYAPGRLPFCHDPRYRLRLSDRHLCELSHLEQQRCPALQKACRAGGALQPPREPPRDARFVLPTWVGMLAEGTLWLLLGALVVGIVVAVLRSRRARRVEDAESALPDAEEAPNQAAPAVSAPAETDVQRLLARARRAAERGEMGPAIDAAHAAAMQGLSATGQLELERDRTNGDYLRDLRKSPPLHEDFKVIVARVEAAQFGGAPPTRAAFDGVWEGVTALLRRLSLLGLLLLVGCKSGGGGEHPVETQETSPSGLYTFKRLLVEQGAEVHTRIQPLTKLDAIAAIVVFENELEPEEKDSLLRWVKAGGVLLSVGTTDFDEAGAVSRGFAGCGHAAKYRSADGWEATQKLVVMGDVTLEVDPDSPVPHVVHVECGGKPYIASSFLGGGAIRYLPERELLTNASLSVADNANLVAELLQVEEGDTVELVGPWTGSGATSPVQSLKAAGMLPFMLQLLLLGALFALRVGTSFGKRRDDTRSERRAFADHVRAIASTYHRAGAGHLASGHYALLLLEQLRERLFPGQSPTLVQLACGVARRTGRAERDVASLLMEAKSGLDQGIEGEGVNHKLIRELEQLSQQVGGVS